MLRRRITALLLVTLSVLTISSCGSKERPVPISSYEDRVKQKCTAVSVTENTSTVYLTEGKSLGIPQWDAADNEVLKTTVSVDNYILEILSVRDVDGNIYVAYSTSDHCYMTGRGAYFVNEDNNLVCNSCYNIYTLDVLQHRSDDYTSWCYPHSLSEEQYRIVNKEQISQICPTYEWVERERESHGECGIAVTYETLYSYVSCLREYKKSQIDFDWDWRVSLVAE